MPISLPQPVDSILVRLGTQFGKIATPLGDLKAKDIKLNNAYLEPCINSRASGLATAANVFKDASESGN